MKPLASRILNEPAVFLGLLASIGVVVVTIASGDPWDTAAIIATITPLAEALGVRQLVTPTHKKE